MTWTSDELTRIELAEELQIASLRRDGTLRKSVIIWVVRLGDSVYGSYLDREQALLDAVDAARDAQQSGCQAQVWLREQADAARIF